ncbi:MAG: hydroxymethylglutaryl-CoA reductase, degradative [Polyangiaceae bacterium]|nr:hydroxymethylglutaryl-CoA reductase, degradative [Polyangiaceae bacterium]
MVEGIHVKPPEVVSGRRAAPGRAARVLCDPLVTERSSRLPGFYRLSLEERRQLIAERAGLDVDELVAIVGAGGLDATTADKVVENVIGTYGLPFGVASNVRVNGRDVLVPMVVEEPSVIAAASNAARMVRGSGGFVATATGSVMTTQVQLSGVRDAAAARVALEARAAELLAAGAAAVEGLVARGGGPREIEVRDLGEGFLVVHVHVDCLDAMGANLVNSVAEALGPEIARLAGGQLGLRILTNLSDRRRVRVTCRVATTELAEAEGPAVADAIVLAARFAELDPYRAATHNKGIMNGVDAVVLATGNDFRAVEAGAHAYAARSGRYAPLSRWWRDGDALAGELELPLALGTVGGTLRVHPGARLALALLGVSRSTELAMIAASVGLASNLAALRALATEGIQRGHMSLHARSVAAAAGATGDEVERVARSIAEAGAITLEGAARALSALRDAGAGRTPP